MYYFSLFGILGCLYVPDSIAMHKAMRNGQVRHLLRLLWLRRQHVRDVLRVFPRQSNVPRTFPKLAGQQSAQVSKEQNFGSMCTHFVWLPLATSSSCSFVKRIEVYASVLPTGCIKISILQMNRSKGKLFNIHLSHVTSARMTSPILPPEARYVTTETIR
jgi:hypothetical protein